MIREKATEDLRHMTDEEGLILQGCGGDLQEWVDGINDLLTQEGILLNGTKFEHAATFQHDGLTNLLFSFEGVQLNVGKLAMWRIQTHSQFGGTWLSDYVPNRLGGFLEQPNQQEREMCIRDRPTAVPRPRWWGRSCWRDMNCCFAATQAELALPPSSPRKGSRYMAYFGGSHRAVSGLSTVSYTHLGHRGRLADHQRDQASPRLPAPG